MTYKFTNRAEKALEIANELAIELNHNYIGTEHLLYGLVNEGTGVASKVLEMQGVTSEKVLEEIEMLIGRGNEEQEKTEVNVSLKSFRSFRILCTVRIDIFWDLKTKGLNS